jgi:hypothetical protein
MKRREFIALLGGAAAVAARGARAAAGSACAWTSQRAVSRIECSKLELGGDHEAAGIHSGQTFPQRGRYALGGQDHGKYNDQQQGNLLILKEIHGREQLKADAASADEAEHQ